MSAHLESVEFQKFFDVCQRKIEISIYFTKLIQPQISSDKTTPYHSLKQSLVLALPSLVGNFN